MGNGQHPGPAGTIGGSFPVDDGTLARTSSPPPPPIGLKGGSAKGSEASIADQIVAYARQRLGQVVGDGECFTLVDRALRNAGARSAADFAPVTPDADYEWGTTVTLSDLRPGDVIQFRDYQCDVETQSRTEVASERQTRPHHTAIVERTGDHGAVTVLEQNIPEGTGVTRHVLRFTSGTWSSGVTTTTVQVQGTFWFYRPQSR